MSQAERVDNEDARQADAKGPEAVPLVVDRVSFRLRLAGTALAWANYEKLSRMGAIYEPLMTACLTRVLKHLSMPRFMDVGAYLGYFACYASALLSKDAEVSAIESNPIFAGAIGQSARLNGFSQLTVLQAALSDIVEPVAIDGLTVVHGGEANNATTTTLDDLCQRHRLQPTVIKIDVHGAEGKVLLGARRTLAAADVVLLELHRLCLLHRYSPGVTRTAVLDALEGAGLTLYYMAAHARHRPAAEFDGLLHKRGFSYRRLDRQSRDLLLFDRREDEFVLALRRDDIESLLGPNTVDGNE